MSDSEKQFTYFSSSKSAEEQRRSSQYLVGEWEEDPELLEVLNMQMKKYEFQQHIQIQSEYRHYTEDWGNIAEGSLHFINFLLEREQEGKPVSGIFFLDKSARPASYLLRKLWGELQKSGLVQHELPPIHFMNIGKGDEHKHKRAHTNSLVARAFGDSLQDGLVVVDEYISSGASARHALRTLESLYNVEAVALAQYRELVDWYGWKKITGVDDAPLSEELYAAMERLSEEEFEALREFYEEYKKEPKEFERVYFKTGNVGFGFFGIRQERLVSEVAEAAIRKLKDKRVLSSKLFQYFHTYGGFLSQGDGTKNSEFQTHRKLLAHFAKILAPHISRKSE